MGYIIITSLMLLKAISSFIFDRNVFIKDLILIPFWPIMLLSDKGISKLENALGAREYK
jgi:hypothetical protein